MINFDTAPILYWLTGYFLAGIAILSAFFEIRYTKIFLLISILLVVFMRLPVLVFNAELNADESQMLSHAITLAKDPVYWRSVDGTTIGPLDNYLLVIPHLLGFQINYASGRAMGLFCICIGLLFMFFALKNWFGGPHARRLFLVPLIFLAFTQEKDFVHYSSEQVPFLLLSVQIWLLSLLSTKSYNFNTVIYFSGFVSGAVPFAKLQGVPLAALLTFCAAWLWYQSYRENKNFLPLLLLFVGCITFPLVVFACVFSKNLLQDLIDFYILSNIMYTEGNSSRSMLDQFLAILDLSVDFKVFTSILLLVFLGAAIKFIWKGIKSRSHESFFLPTVFFLLIFASVYSVTKSGKDFVHYLYFCIAAWTLLAAYGTAGFSRWSIILPCLILLGFFVNDLQRYRQERRFNDFISNDSSLLGQSQVIEEVKKHTSSEDYMVVWGWNCSYYVEAQLAQGTAENHSERSIFESVLVDRYRDRYISDIKRTKPAVFLDATGKNSLWLQNRELYSHETFPELAAYIRVNYIYKGDFDGTRMYVRKTI